MCVAFGLFVCICFLLSCLLSPWYVCFLLQEVSIDSVYGYTCRKSLEEVSNVSQREPASHIISTIELPLSCCGDILTHSDQPRGTSCIPLYWMFLTPCWSRRSIWATRQRGNFVSHRKPWEGAKGLQGFTIQTNNSVELLRYFLLLPRDASRCSAGTPSSLGPTPAD